MRLRKGQIVKVEFLDHAVGGNHAIRFVVYGEIAAITPTSISIDSWAYADKAARHDGNETRYTIVRNAITSITQLEKRKG
jgi:hypothetical protein